jgi:hypothetical protein
MPGIVMPPPVGTARRNLTEIPDPTAVQRQKETYAKSLEDQLRKGVEILAATHKQQTDALHAQANEEKHRYNLALDQQVKQKELALSQQYNQQLMSLQQAAQTQRADLEQQACGMTLEYQQKKVAEEYHAQQTGIQAQHLQAAKRLEEEIAKLTGGAPPPGMLERVQANVRIGNMAPMATYALPQLPGQVAPLPFPNPSAMRPYVPPPGSFSALPAAMAPPVIRGPSLSYLPQQASQPSLSYVPQTFAQPAMRSYVPPI